MDPDPWGIRRRSRGSSSTTRVMGISSSTFAERHERRVASGRSKPTSATPVAVRSKRSGDEYNFVEQPSRDFFCPVTFDVLLEPYLTECCGNHLSETAYRQLQAQGKPCPVCKEKPLKAVKDKYHKRRVSSLKVRCPHKAEGCEWQGELGSLEKHLNAKSSAGECRYVDVDCPYACGERVQRRSLEKHKSQRCPLRPFTCQYCKHKATFQEVTKKHWPVCKKYPLPCPNECGEKIERRHLKGHLEQTCPLEEIQCDFSYAGCVAQLQRRFMSAHMKEDTDSHLSLVAQRVPEMEVKIKQQGDKIGRLEVQMKQMMEQNKILIKLLGKNDDRLIVVPPVELVMKADFKADNYLWSSSPFYSHLGGYKMHLSVGVTFSVVSVSICLMRGEFDDCLSWPLEGTITLEHPLKITNCIKHDKPNYRNIGTNCWLFDVPMKKLYGEREEYLKNGDLTFCISEVNL